jgi:membrane protein implicated in regulation of membrane protease activity
MTTIFLTCAVVGGTILLFQFVLTFVGFGDGGLEGADDLPDSIDLDFDGDLDVGDPHGSSDLFGVLSFRTITAALTFFGLAGMAAQSGGLTLPVQLTVAIGAGAGAMYSVYYMMRGIYRLGQSGNLQITNAVGKTATVYIPIGVDGQGKVQVKVQDRLVEFAAVNASDHALATGAKVVVVGVVSGNTLKVEPFPEPARVEA